MVPRLIKIVRHSPVEHHLAIIAKVIVQNIPLFAFSNTIESNKKTLPGWPNSNVPIIVFANGGNTKIN